MRWLACNRFALLQTTCSQVCFVDRSMARPESNIGETLFFEFTIYFAIGTKLLACPRLPRLFNFFLPRVCYSPSLVLRFFSCALGTTSPVAQVFDLASFSINAKLGLAVFPFILALSDSWLKLWSESTPAFSCYSTDTALWYCFAATARRLCGPCLFHCIILGS